MDTPTVVALCIINALWVVLLIERERAFHSERKDYINRLQAKSLSEYVDLSIVTNPQEKIAIHKARTAEDEKTREARKIFSEQQAAQVSRGRDRN